MKIEKAAIAGTLESSDVQVTITPSQAGNQFLIESSVMSQYGNQITALAQKVAENLEMENAQIKIVDKGALDCTIKARIETAYFRSIGKNKNIAWKELI
ncbi:citrate lyase acyl carrier protein [Enterococcus sp. LJL90]